MPQRQPLLLVALLRSLLLLAQRPLPPLLLPLSLLLW